METTSQTHARTHSVCGCVCGCHCGVRMCGCASPSFLSISPPLPLTPPLPLPSLCHPRPLPLCHSPIYLPPSVSLSPLHPSPSHPLPRSPTPVLSPRSLSLPLTSWMICTSVMVMLMTTGSFRFRVGRESRE